jgi:transposase-like protein
MIKLSFPEVKPEATRPGKCIYCSSHYLNVHGHHLRKPKDIRLKELKVSRYKCLSCLRTFRVHPPGVEGKKQQTKRTIFLAVALYLLGPSLRGTSAFLSALECPVGRMSVWRDLQLAGQKCRSGYRTILKELSLSLVAGLDETKMRLAGKKMEVFFSVEAGYGLCLYIEVQDQRDSSAIRPILRKLRDELGIEVIITDDHAPYEKAKEEEHGADMAHQLCLVHLKKNASRRLKEAGLSSELGDQIKKALDSLSPSDLKDLEDLEKRPEVRENEKLHRLLIDLLRKWHLLTVHKNKEGVPSNNNFTEAAIGRTKIRAKTTRGHKSPEGLFNFVILTQLAGYFMPLTLDEKRRKERIPKAKSTGLTLKSSEKKRLLECYGGLKWLEAVW